jgi:response regulator RpfG family c-di-GMP phosphodiesterase
VLLNKDRFPPVVVLTAKADESRCIKALDSRASDDIAQSINRTELLKRVAIQVPGMSGCETTCGLRSSKGGSTSCKGLTRKLSSHCLVESGFGEQRCHGRQRTNQTEQSDLESAFEYHSTGKRKL